MRFYVTAQRKAGITEPAKVIDLPIGQFVCANFVIPGKPGKDGREGTNEIVATLAVAAENTKLVKRIKQMSAAEVSPELEEHHFLTNAFGELINEWMLGKEEDELQAGQQTYVQNVLAGMTWGPDGISGTADVFLIPSTLDLVAKANIKRRSDILSDAIKVVSDKDREGALRVTKDGRTMKSIQPLYNSLIGPGCYCGRLRMWPTKITEAVCNSLNPEDVAVLEGELISKSWTPDTGVNAGETRKSLEVRATTLFKLDTDSDCWSPSIEKEIAAATPNAAASALNNDDDDEEDDY